MWKSKTGLLFHLVQVWKPLLFTGHLWLPFFYILFPPIFPLHLSLFSSNFFLIFLVPLSSLFLASFLILLNVCDRNSFKLLAGVFLQSLIGGWIKPQRCIVWIWFTEDCLTFFLSKSVSCAFMYLLAYLKHTYFKTSGCFIKLISSGVNSCLVGFVGSPSIRFIHVF